MIPPNGMNATKRASAAPKLFFMVVSREISTRRVDFRKQYAALAPSVKVPTGPYKERAPALIESGALLGFTRPLGSGFSKAIPMKGIAVHSFGFVVGGLHRPDQAMRCSAGKPWSRISRDLYSGPVETPCASPR